MIKEKHRTDNKIVFALERGWRDWIFSGSIMLFGIMPYLIAGETSGWWESSLRVLFTITFIWIGVVNFGDIESCEVDKEKKTIRVSRETVFGNKKVFVYQLEKLLSVEVEDEDKKYRVILVMEDGITTPLTQTQFAKKEPQEKIAKTIETFLGFDKEKPQVFMAQMSVKQQGNKKQKK